MSKVVINRVLLDALFNTYNARFNAGMETAVPNVPNLLKVEDLAMLMKVSGAGTVHAWMNQVPGMKERVGARVIEEISVGKLTVTNRDFESTIAVPRNDIEDDNYGVFANLAQAMGASAALLWIELAMEAFLANGLWADGFPFFCANRELSDKSGAMTNVVTTALSTAAVEQGLAVMRTWNLHGGKNADVTPVSLIVGPASLALAKQIVEAQLVVSGGSTASNTSTATMLKVLCDSRISGAHAGKWYIGAEKAGIKPVAVQQRKMPTFTRMDRENDENVFMWKEYRYGTDARGEGFLTLPFLAYAGGFKPGDIVDASAED